MTIPDFQSLLSLNQRLHPSNVTQIVPREAFKPSSTDSTNAHHLKHHQLVRKTSIINTNRQQRKDPDYNTQQNGLLLNNSSRGGIISGRDPVLVFKVDRSGNAQVVSPDRAKVIQKSSIELLQDDNNEQTTEEDAVIVEGDLCRDNDETIDDDGSNDDDGSYYIVGDKKLSCPYEYNSKEYIAEQLLGGMSSTTTIANLIHQHGTEDNLLNSEVDSIENDANDRKSQQDVNQKLSKKKELQNSHKIVIEDPSAVSMQDSYLLTEGGTKRDQQILKSRRRVEELAHKLSLSTPLCTTVTKDIKKEDEDDEESAANSILNHINRMSESERIRLEKQRKKEELALPPVFHEVVLGDWESQINWEGYTDADDDSKSINKNDTTISPDMERKPVKYSSQQIKPLDPQTLLQHPVNPYLDALDFSNLISWEGADAPPGYNHKLAEQVGKLILEDRVAGSSIAKTCGAMILSSTDTTTLNPQPFNQSQVFQNRMDRSQSIGVGSMGTLQANVAEREAEIQRRQRKREQIEIDKTNRITKALGTLALGALGRGRTITSSLMGPGGTERTGRPSGMGGLSSLTHDMEYVEELELVYNHIMIKPDLSRNELRQLFRPKLPRKVFMSGGTTWQCQIRLYKNHQYNLLNAQGDEGVGKRKTSTTTVSGKSGMPGAHMSQPKIRNEADLSPTEGSLILLEYSEERPPIQLLKGMTCKIVNYYRGDRSKCPISFGGGDRPTRKKKHGDKAQDTGVMKGGSGKVEKPPRLKGPVAGAQNAIDLIGKIGSKNAENESSTNQSKSKESPVTILPEGITEILHSKVHGPFIGSVEEGITQTGLISNVFAAPMFRHEPRSTDFLMILGKKVQSATVRAKLGVVLRPMPSSVFCVGQVEPRIKVFAPSSTLEKDFMTKFSSYQIAKGLQRMQAKEKRGLKIDEIDEEFFPNTEKLVKNTLRQRIKEVAQYDKNTQIWTLKKEGEDGFRGVEALGREVAPEGVAANQMSCASVRRLRDFGVIELSTESNSAQNVTTAMVYLSGAINAARERKTLVAKRAKAKVKSKQAKLYATAEEKLKKIWNDLKRKGEVARFIQEELQLSSWHLSSEFIDVHKDPKGTAMMKLTGLGDPSGRTEAYNFLREADARPNKGVGNNDGALNSRIKKITGTENDLRKLNMKQMADILSSYGMGHKEVSKLKRWDRVHVIRDLSTKAASDKMDDGFKRYARGEKMKLSEQREEYRQRIEAIWKKQRVALSVDTCEPDVRSARKKKTEIPNSAEVEDDDDSDDESDFFDTFEKEEGEEGDLIDLKRKREEERAAQIEMNAIVAPKMVNQPIDKDRKVIRRKITKKFPNGDEKVYFKFIVKPEEVEKELAKKKKKDQDKTINPHEDEKKKVKKRRTKQGNFNELLSNIDNSLIGHAVFEDDDEEPTKIQSTQVKQRKRDTKRRRGNDDSPLRMRKVIKSQTKLKQKASQEKRMKKRKREAEEVEYLISSKRKGTSNRRERGSARDRKAHVIMADRLQQIRSDCEKRPGSIPFLRPVDKRRYSRYYEVISNPIDLQTIRDKIGRYEYKLVDAFVNDFEIMMNNAVKYNGVGSVLGTEATAIYEFVKSTVAENRKEFDHMEQAVREQMQNSGRKKARATSPKNETAGEKERKSGKDASLNVNLGGTTVYLGNDLKSSLMFDATSNGNSSEGT